MARGGYISSEAAISTLFRAVGDRAKAVNLITDALRSKAMQAQGCRQLPQDMPKHNAAQKVVLRDLSDMDSPLLADRTLIPVVFWTKATSRDRSMWDLEQGWVVSSLGKEGSAYQDLRLREKDVNALVELQAPSKAANKTVQRARQSRWEDWMAAIVFLAHEHRINGHMTQASLVRFIGDKLGEWGFPEGSNLEPSTVNPILRAILKQYKGLPPYEPKNVA